MYNKLHFMCLVKILICCVVNRILPYQISILSTLCRLQ